MYIQLFSYSVLCACEFEFAQTFTIIQSNQKLRIMKTSTMIWVLAMSVLHAQIYFMACAPLMQGNLSTVAVSAPPPELKPEVELLSTPADVPDSTTTDATATLPTPAPDEFDGDDEDNENEDVLDSEGSSTTTATTATSTLTTPKFVPDHINERVVDEERVEMAFKKPLIYKSFDCINYKSECMKCHDGKITFIPPKGHGLVAVIQEMSLRTNADLCRFGYRFYPKCMKCVDHLQFSTATKRSDKTCGDVDVNLTEGPLMTMLGEVSFIGGIDQELVIDLHQEEAFGLDMAPSFVVSVTPFNDCRQSQKNETADTYTRKCPPARNGAEESYCIHGELFCDRVLNCPVAGPLSSTYGLQTDESNDDCALKFLQEITVINEESDEGGEMFTPLGLDDDDDKSYEIKAILRPESRLVKTDFAYRKHTLVQLPMYSDVPDAYILNERLNEMEGARVTAQKKLDTSPVVSKWLKIGFLVFSVILTFILCAYVIVRCMTTRRRPKMFKKVKKSGYLVPQQKAPGYTRLDTFSFQTRPRKAKVSKVHSTNQNKVPDSNERLVFGVYC